MNENTTKPGKAPEAEHDANAVMSQMDLARLGGGHVAYIKVLNYDEARRMFPAVEDLPAGIQLFALHAADGTPIALTDSRQAALSHAMEGELEVALLN